MTLKRPVAGNRGEGQAALLEGSQSRVDIQKKVEARPRRKPYNTRRCPRVQTGAWIGSESI
jgi:hypothetical protein